jgi:hypothetical protein
MVRFTNVRGTVSDGPTVWEHKAGCVRVCGGGGRGGGQAITGGMALVVSRTALAWPNNGQQVDPRSLLNPIKQPNTLARAPAATPWMAVACTLPGRQGTMVG